MRPEAEIEYWSRVKHLNTENVTIINTSGLVGDHFGTIYTRDASERDKHHTPQRCCKYTISARGEQAHNVEQVAQYRVTLVPGRYSWNDARLHLEVQPGCSSHRPASEDVEHHYSRVLVFTHHHFYHYGHCKHDILPPLYQACRSKVYDLILIPGPKPQDMETFTDLGLDNVKMICREEEIKFTSDVVDWETNSGWDTWIYDNWFLQRERKEIKDLIDKQIGQLITVSEQNKLVYCQRVEESCSLGRILSEEQELDVQRVLSKYALDNGLEYVRFFSCKDMTHLDQIKLFREAKMVVGLHGTALANLHYVDPTINCKVLEFSHAAWHTQYGFSGGMLGDYMDYYISPIVDGNGKSNEEQSKVTISMRDLEHFLAKTSGSRFETKSQESHYQAQEACKEQGVASAELVG